MMQQTTSQINKSSSAIFSSLLSKVLCVLYEVLYARGVYVCLCRCVCGCVRMRACVRASVYTCVSVRVCVYCLC